MPAPSVNLSATHIVIISERDDGGGVIEIPMLSVGKIDLNLTARPSDSAVDVTTELLRQLEDNFPAWGRPVPIGVSPHEEFGARAGRSPGFVDSVKVRGETIYGQIDLIAPLFQEVKRGLWRGWSVEMVDSPKTATEKIDGWVLTGGIFTNRPATPVHFKVAAEGETDQPTVIVYSALELVEPTHEEDTMTDKERIAELEAKVAEKDATIKTKDATITGLESTRDTLTQDKAGLDQRLIETTSNLNKANAERVEASDKLVVAEATITTRDETINSQKSDLERTTVSLQSEQARNKKSDILVAIKKGIDRGIAPAYFEGHEKDPVKWYDAKFGSMSLEQFDGLLKSMPVVDPSTVPSSGGDDADADETVQVSAEVAKGLRKQGLDASLANVQDTDELRELREKQAEEKEKGK